MTPAAPMQQDPLMAGMKSPGETNFLMQEDHIEEKEKAYASAFSDQAYSVLGAKYPQLINSVVTFKIIKSSIEAGDAVGAFILNLQGDTLYVPVIMANNKFKPLDIVYSKRTDKFFPFTKEWLSIIATSNTQELGAGVKTPETLEGDKDITNLMRPPLYGRAVYAMDLSGISHIDVLKAAGSEAKAAYKALLKERPEYLKFATEHFDVKEIIDALRPKADIEKKASVPVKLEVVDLKDPAKKIKETFGKKAQKAMRDMASDGFAFKDERPGLNKVMSTTETKLHLEEPSNSGVYQLCGTDGSMFTALVIVEPEPLTDRFGEYSCYEDRDQTYTLGDHSQRRAKERHDYLVIKENGDFFRTHKLIASPSLKEAFGGSLGNAIFAGKKHAAGINSNVFFIKTEGDIIAATTPILVDKVETRSDGNKKYVKKSPFALASGGTTKSKKEDDYDAEIIHAQTPTGKLLRLKNSRTTVVPKTYRIVRLGDELHHSPVLASAREVLEYAQRRMNGTSNCTVKLASLGAGEYAINGESVGQLKEAAVKLATDYNVAMATAVREFKKLAVCGDSARIMIIPAQEKEASIFDSGSDGNQMTPELVQGMYDHGGGEAAAMGQDPIAQIPEAMEQPNTALMDIGIQTADRDLYNVGALNSLVQFQDIKELLSVHSPILEKSLDSVGRMLLTFWIKGQKAVKDLGEDSYFTLEESLRTVFRELGSLILKLNQRSAAASQVTDLN